MDVRQAKQIIEIWKLGSFGAAARELGISQPALSRSIARIEDELGVTLFERGPKGAQATVFAEYVVAKVNPVLDRLSNLTTEIRQMAKGDAGRLVVGIGPVPCELIMPDVGERVAALFPRLRLVLQQTLAPDLMKKLIDRALDVAIVSSEVMSSSTFSDAHEFVVTELFSEHVQFFVRKDHPILEKKAKLCAEDLLEYPIAAPTMMRALRGAFPKKLTQEQRQNLHGFQVHDYRLIGHAVRRTNTIGFAPAMIYAREFEAGDVVALDIGYDCPPHDCIAVVTPEAWHSPVIRKFVAIAKDVSEALPSAAVTALHPKLSAAEH